MPRHAAYVLLVVIALALVGADFLILTSSAGISRLARVELEKVFGSSLRFEDLEASLDGTLRFRGVGFGLEGGQLPVVFSDEALIRVSQLGLSPRVEQVVLRSPLFYFHEKLLGEISRGTGGRPLREVVEAGTLPRIECEGGEISAVYSEVLHPGVPHRFRIESLLLVPFGDYSYLMSGSVSHDRLGSWSISGEANLETGAVRVALSAPALKLGPAVRERLSETVRSHWDSWNPEGTVEVYVRIEGDGRRPLNITATVRPTDLAVTYAKFPYRVETLSGEIDFLRDGFHVKTLSGRRGDARFRASGRSSGYEADASYSIHIEADRLPLVAELRAALDDEERGIFDLFSPTGFVSARGDVIRPAGKDVKVQTPLELSFRECSFRFRDFPYEVRNVEGWIDVVGGTVTVRGLRASDRGTDFRVEGVIRDIAKNADIDVFIAARGLPLDFRLKQALDPKTQALWDDFSPEGKVDVEWRVRRESGRDVTHRGTIHAGGENVITSRQVPLLLTGTRGEVEYTPEAVRLNYLSGKCAGADLLLHGTIRPEGGMSLRIDAVGLKIDEPFVRAMPGPVRRILERVKLGGESNVRMDLDLGKDETTYTLDLKLNQGRIRAAVPFDEVQGTVSLNGMIRKEEGKEKSRILGHVNFARTKIAGKTFSDLLASLNMTDSMLRFGSIKASAYGGIVTGTFFVDIDSGTYGGEFAADRLDLREYTRETESFKEEPILGKVSLELKELTGQGEDLASMTGTGTVTIRDGFLWKVPLFASLWTLNPQNLFQSRNQFEAGSIAYAIREKRFHLREIVFTGADVNVVGRGSVAFDGGLDLVLRAQSGSLLGLRIPGMDLILSPLNILKDSFLGVHITGTFEKPESGLKMFPGIGD